jgi:hypothetical protein
MRPLAARPHGRFGRPRRRLRAGLVQLLCALAGLVFVFSVTTALVIGDRQKVSVIVPAAEVLAVLASLALIRSLQVKAFACIQLAPTLSAIAGQGPRHP